MRIRPHLASTMVLHQQRLIQGHALDRVANPDAVDSFEALTYFVRFAEGVDAGS